MTTRGEWAIELLHALGNQNPTDQTVNWVASWTLGENTKAVYNPLATTQPMPDATDFNVVGVKNYKDDQQGIDATVKTLNNGYYPHILHGLQTNDTTEASNAVELGIWGTGMGFVTLAHTGDHRGETLLSHSFQPGGGGGGDFTTKPPDLGNIWEVGAGGKPNAATKQYASELGINPQDVTRNVSFIALGGVLLLIAVVLAIKTYVPTRQIVKTIAG